MQTDPAAASRAVVPLQHEPARGLVPRHALQLFAKLLDSYATGKAMAITISLAHNGKVGCK